MEDRMKKYLCGLLIGLFTVCSAYSMAAPPTTSEPRINYGFIIIILAFLALVIYIEILIGKYIGTRLSNDAGLIVGLILTVLGISLFIGISTMVYSAKKKNKSISYKKFIGKNYKDILLENNLGEYIDIFTENKLTDIQIISELTDSELEKIGVVSLGDRKRIKKLFSLE